MSSWAPVAPVDGISPAILILNGKNEWFGVHKKNRNPPYNWLICFLDRKLHHVTPWTTLGWSFWARNVWQRLYVWHSIDSRCWDFTKKGPGEKLLGKVVQALWEHILVMSQNWIPRISKKHRSFEQSYFEIRSLGRSLNVHPFSSLPLIVECPCSGLKSNSLFVNSLQYILFGFYHVLSLLLLAEIHMFVANKGPTLLLARQSRQKLHETSTATKQK